MAAKFEIKAEAVAAVIAEKLHTSFNLLGDSLILARENASEQDAKTFSDGVGDAFYAIVFKLLEPLYEQHPHLKPPGWDEQSEQVSA